MMAILGVLVVFLIVWLAIGATIKTAAIIAGIVFIAVALSPHSGGRSGRRY